MIVSVSAKNVRRHRDVCIPLDSNQVRVSGPNGVGKSTLGDALAFAFTGRDKNGAQAPVHLITEGETKMEVSVETAKAIITRSLTAKKSSTLKLTPKVSGIPVTLNQTEFSQKMGCSPEVFLSACFAGFFFTLDIEKRMEVLRAVAPPVDRGQVLRQILSETCPDVDFTHYGAYLEPTKRSDIERAKVAETRRDVERRMDTLRGRFEEKSGPVQNPPPRPVVDDSQYKAVEARYGIWNTYRKAMELREKEKIQAAAHSGVVKEWETRFDSINEQMSLIPTERADNQDELLSIGQELADWKGKLLPLPQRPPSLSLPESDRCMTCGQVIGSKHREKMAADLQKAEEEYRAACEVVEAENQKIKEKISEIEEKYEEAKKERLKIKEHNKVVQKQLTAIQGELKDHLKQRPHPITVSPEPKMPVVEEISFDEFKEEHSKLMVAKELQRLWDEAQHHTWKVKEELGEIAEAMMKLDNTHKALSWIEGAYGLLDQRVFQATAGFYDLGDGFRIHAEDKSVTVVNEDGKPYEWMSTGEQVRTSIRLCEKIGGSLKPRAPFLFVDNADLMDHTPRCSVPQVFLVYVKNDGGLFVDGNRV